jgi:hypothetical protein
MTEFQFFALDSKETSRQQCPGSESARVCSVLWIRLYFFKYNFSDPDPTLTLISDPDCL